MLLGGVETDERLVRELTRIVGRPLAHKLEKALLSRSTIVALTRDEMRAILEALETPPPEVHELRRHLLEHGNRRLRERL